MIIDFHSHLLPGIDDGAKTIEESMAILSKANNDGVSLIIATPHFYPSDSSIKDFIEKRNAAYDCLLQTVSTSSLPNIKLGAEVYFSPVLIGCDNLKQLCIEDTDYMLLELPYTKITTKIIDDIEKLTISHNITPIIAHLERYIDYTSLESIDELMQLDVLGQVNASSVTHPASYKVVKKLLKYNYLHVLGSDAHNTTSRPVMIKEALQTFSKKKKENIFKNFMNNAKLILSNYDIEEIV